MPSGQPAELTDSRFARCVEWAASVLLNGAKWSSFTPHSLFFATFALHNHYF